MATHNQLVYLVEVVKEQSFTKAAEKLYVSQSTLSKSVKALETELDVEIIKRNSKNFALTEAGEEVYAYARRILNFDESETDALKKQLHDKAGCLRIGIPPTAGPAYFYSRVYAFRKVYPDVRLELEETPSTQLVEKLDSGKIDIGTVLEPYENDHFIKIPVYESQIGICLSRDHPLASRKSVRLKELEEEPFLMMTPDYMFRAIVDNYCREAGFEPRVVFESSQWDLLYHMAASGFGIAFLPVWMGETWDKPEVRMLPVEDPRMPWVLSLCYLKNRHLTEPMRNFLSICQKESIDEFNS